MHLLTWNVNGLRAVSRRYGTTRALLELLKADILCFQETKLTRAQLEEDVAMIDGFHAFFSLCRKSGGLAYSGVVTYCRMEWTPVAAAEGFMGTLESMPKEGSDIDEKIREAVGCTRDEMEALDAEGRCVLTDHRDFVLLNVYFPRAGCDEERFDFKMRFSRAVHLRCKSLQDAGREVVLVGDVNVAHQRRDHCDPYEGFDEYPARQWLDKFLGGDEEESSGRLWVDVFRCFHPSVTEAYTCWNTMTGARATNYGTRIDYIIATRDLVTRVFQECTLLSSIEGSDHCPVLAQTHSLQPTGDRPPPSLCARYLPEFRARQHTLTGYLSSRSDSSEIRAPTPRTSGFSETTRQTTLTSFFSTHENRVPTPSPPAPSRVDPLIPSSSSSVSSSTDSVAQWKALLGGIPVPHCHGHREPCVLRTVVKEGPNKGRPFFVCARPQGHLLRGGRCNHFEWAESGPNTRRVRQGDHPDELDRETKRFRS